MRSDRLARHGMCGAQQPSGGDGPIDGNVDENKQITLKIQSAAPLKSNYQALLRTEAEGTQLYNRLCSRSGW